MNHLFYILLGIAPSLIWLSFYLRKDAHPEPKKTVLKIFFLGMASAPLAALIEKGVENLISLALPYLPNLAFFFQIFYYFLGVAFVEEYLKYLVVERKYIVVKNGVLREPEFDEALDVMLYMVIAGLGFAALENILLFFTKNPPFFEAFLIASLRFIGATFLHALCSGILGLFMAFSFFETEKRKVLLFAGFAIAILLHGLYDFSIIKMRGDLKFLFPLLILGILAIFVSFGFKKLKGMASICKV